jgi:hypothetical protein
MAKARMEKPRGNLCDIQLAFVECRQLPTDQNHAVPTREYQTDSSSKTPGPLTKPFGPHLLEAA